MKKRIVCVLLALIMLVGLVPATAITAAAATGSMSENAITVQEVCRRVSVQYQV